MKIAGKVFGIIAVSMISFVLFIATAFASPALSDADITFSVRGYYSQYAFSTTWTRAYLNTSGGVTDTAAYLFTSDYFSVTPGGTFFCMYGGGFTVAPSRYVSFFDSDYQYIQGQGWYNEGGHLYCSVPTGAAYARLTQNANNPCYIISTPFVVSSSSMPYIFNEIQNISISEEGVVTIPYQINNYSEVFLDFRFFDSTRHFSNLSFNTHVTYTGGYFEGVREASYTSSDVAIRLYSYYFRDDNTSDPQYFQLAAIRDNPARFNVNITSSLFSGFRIFIPAPTNGLSLSTSMMIKFYDFQLDGVDSIVSLQMDSAITGLDNIGDQLAVPSPDPSAIYQNINQISLQMSDQNFNSVEWFGPSGGLLMSMMLTVFTFAALGYILYGKR